MSDLLRLMLSPPQTNKVYGFIFNQISVTYTSNTHVCAVGCCTERRLNIRGNKSDKSQCDVYPVYTHFLVLLCIHLCKKIKTCFTSKMTFLFG